MKRWLCQYYYIVNVGKTMKPVKHEATSHYGMSDFGTESDFYT